MPSIIVYFKKRCFRPRYLVKGLVDTLYKGRSRLLFCRSDKKCCIFFVLWNLLCYLFLFICRFYWLLPALDHELCRCIWRLTERQITVMQVLHQFVILKNELLTEWEIRYSTGLTFLQISSVEKLNLFVPKVCWRKPYRSLDSTDFTMIVSGYPQRRLLLSLKIY